MREEYAAKPVEANADSSCCSPGFADGRRRICAGKNNARVHGAAPNKADPIVKHTQAGNVPTKHGFHPVVESCDFGGPSISAFDEANRLVRGCHAGHERAKHAVRRRGIQNRSSVADIKKSIAALLGDRASSHIGAAFPAGLLERGKKGWPPETRDAAIAPIEANPRAQVGVDLRNPIPSSGGDLENRRSEA